MTTWTTPTIALRFGRGDEANQLARSALAAQRTNGGNLPTFDDVLALWPGFADAQFAFVGGSVTEGWAHSKSDLDVYVVADSPIHPDTRILEVAHRQVDLPSPDIYICIGQVAQFRADIELWTIDQLEQLASIFDSGTPSQEVAGVGGAERDLIYRLTSGTPLTGADFWRQWRSRFLSGHYRQYLAASKQLVAEGLAEDVAGMLDSGDVRSAALAAFNGAATAIEGVLASRGDFCVNRKWLSRRLERLDDLVPPDTLWSALSMRDATTDPGRYAASALELTQSLIAIIEDAR